MSRSTSGSSSNIESFRPAESVPIIRTQSRRDSIFDYGGVNSLNNFASSVRRSVGYLSSSLDSSAGIGHSDTSPLYENAIDEETGSSFEQNVVGGSVSSARNGPGISTAPTSTTGLNSESPSYGSVYGATPAKIEDDHEFVVVSQRSTPLQTVFNSINVLIGIGILSIPFAIHLAGWIPGLILLLFAALSTRYTAILLGRIQSKHRNLHTYQDIARHVYGNSVSYLIFAIFSLDLCGAGVSMIILFSDSFSALFPELSPVLLKTVLCTALVALNLMPLRFLSFLSCTGILCTTFTLFSIIASGLCKRTAPGSLWEVMPTNLFPSSFVDLCFSIGLFMAPWGGHATFPEIYTDQQKPKMYRRCIDVTFSFCYVVDCITGIVGFLMFGSLIGDEVSRNILLTDGYPSAIKTLIVVLMGLLPISKLPLVSRPIVTLVEKLGQDKTTGQVSLWWRIGGMISISALFLAASLLITSFGKVMSALGSTICLTVSVTFPVLLYMSTFDDVLTSWDRVGLTAIVVVSLLGVLLGTAAVFLV